MERRQRPKSFVTYVTVTSGSFSGDLPTITSANSSPSHAGSGVVSTPTDIPSNISSPSVESSSSSTTPLASLSGPPSPSNDAASVFLSNKGAMAGLFAGLGILILSVFAIVYLGWISRRRKDSKQRKSQEASVTFSTIMRRHNPFYQGSEPRQTFSIQQTIPQSPYSHRISVPGVSEWLTRRRERRSSQFIYHSRPPSTIDEDVKHLGEETQWTLGKVLEDQRHQVIRPLPPVPGLPIKQPKPARSIPRALSSRRFSRGGRSIGESEGGRFTLEDALLPSIASSPAPYELGSSQSGRHPYANAYG